MTDLGVTRRPVGALATAVLAHRVLVRQIATRFRIGVLGALGAGIVVLGVALDPSTRADPVEFGVAIVTRVGFTVIAPVVALVFAAVVLGDTREDGTLVYLWLRPLRRWPIVLGAYTAALTVVLPMTVVPVVGLALVLDVGGGLVGATLLASIVGAIGYCALFLLLGLVLRSAVAIGGGLLYILIWEAIAASLGTAPARMAIRGYTRSIITDRTGVELELADVSQTAGIVVPLVVAGVALALATWRLDRLDVA